MDGFGPNFSGRIENDQILSARLGKAPSEDKLLTINMHPYQLTWNDQILGYCILGIDGKDLGIQESKFWGNC